MLQLVLSPVNLFLNDNYQVGNWVCVFVCVCIVEFVMILKWIFFLIGTFLLYTYKFTTAYES